MLAVSLPSTTIRASGQNRAVATLIAVVVKGSDTLALPAHGLGGTLQSGGLTMTCRCRGKSYVLAALEFKGLGSRSRLITVFTHGVGAEPRADIGTRSRLKWPIYRKPIVRRPSQRQSPPGPPVRQFQDCVYYKFMTYQVNDSPKFLCTQFQQPGISVGLPVKSVSMT